MASGKKQFDDVDLGVFWGGLIGVFITEGLGYVDAWAQDVEFGVWTKMVLGFLAGVSVIAKRWYTDYQAKAAKKAAKQ